MSKKSWRKAWFLASSQEKYILTETTQGLHFVVSTRDQVMGRSIFVDKAAFDSELVDFALASIPSLKRRRLFDIGAHIGTISLYGAHLGFDEVIAFEPDPENFAALRANAILNGAEEVLTCYNCALSNESNPATSFQLSPTNMGGHRLRPSIGGASIPGPELTTITVETKAIDALIPPEQSEGALWCVDVQGAEGHVLAGGRKHLNFRPALILEFNPGQETFDGSTEAIGSAILRAGYEGLVVFETGHRLNELDKHSFFALSDELKGHGEVNLVIW